MDFSLEVPDVDDTPIKELLFKNYVEGSGDSLELNDDNTYLVSLESALTGLNQVLSGIQKAGMMCQSFALEAHAVTDNFITPEVPIGMYTKIPTATRYRESLETLSNGVIALILAGIAAVIAICYKLYKWVFGKDGGKDTTGIPASRISKAMEDSAEVKQAFQEVAQTQTEVVKVFDDLVKEINTAIRNDHTGAYKSSAKTSFTLKDIEAMVMNYQATKDAKNFRPAHLKAGDSVLHDLVYNVDAFTYDILNDGVLMHFLYKAEMAVVVWPAFLMRTIELVDVNLALVSAAVRQVNLKPDVRANAMAALADLDKFVKSANGGGETAMLKGVSYTLPFDNKQVNPVVISMMIDDMYNAVMNSSEKRSFNGFQDFLTKMSRAKLDKFFSSVEKMYASQNVENFKKAIDRLEELRKSMNEVDQSLLIDNTKMMSQDEFNRQSERNKAVTNKLSQMGHNVDLSIGKGQQAIGSRELFNLYKDIINIVHRSIVGYNKAFSVYNKVYSKIAQLNTQAVESIKDFRHVLKENNFVNSTEGLKEINDAMNDAYKKYADNVKKF